MENITIKSVTHCPTCGSECKVNGGTTQYYVPIKKYTEEDVLKYAWFLVKNIGQYACDKTANFEGKYLEQFKNKQD